MDTAYHRHATVVGTQGTLYTEYLNHTSDKPAGDRHGYQPSELRVRRGAANVVPLERVTVATGSGFYFAAEAFAKMVAERDVASVERAAAASIDIAAMLEAIAESAKTGSVVQVPGAVQPGKGPQGS
jgi:predicted dehydrogenase